jgi:hypothetical protein
MAQRVMPKDPSKDQAWRQVNTMPVELPPPDTRRWVPRRKAVIVNAVRRGAISLEEVCRRYQLSVEEFATWQRARLRLTVCRVCASLACRCTAMPAAAQPGRGAMQHRLLGFLYYDVIMT